MATLIRLSLLLCVGACLSACAAQAAPLQTNQFYQWLQGVEQEAVASGVSPDTASAALDHVILDDRVIALDQKQPESTVTFDAYSRRIVSADRVALGKSLLEKNTDLLDEISERYGVQPQVIVALWGMESSFGRNSGDFSVVDSLVTLSYAGRRADFFRKELINALHILDQEHIPAASLRGSWAGAMGQCQFMPSTYLRYAVDYSKSGQRDIWENRADVFASIANYIAAEGWTQDMTWGREVSLSDSLDSSEIGLEQKHLLSEWSALGVQDLNGNPLPNRPIQASLVQPDGPNGRSFLVYDNFRALMRWNHSTYFAVSVGLLADRIKE